MATLKTPGPEDSLTQQHASVADDSAFVTADVGARGVAGAFRASQLMQTEVQRNSPEQRRPTGKEHFALNKSPVMRLRKCGNIRALTVGGTIQYATKQRLTQFRNQGHFQGIVAVVLHVRQLAEQKTRIAEIGG